MVIEKNKINGSWVISELDSTNHLLTRVYFFYTKKEAIYLFKKALKKRR